MRRCVPLLIGFGLLILGPTGCDRPEGVAGPFVGIHNHALIVPGRRDRLVKVKSHVPVLLARKPRHAQVHLLVVPAQNQQNISIASRRELRTHH